MSEQKIQIVMVSGVLINNGKLLMVKELGASGYCLPRGQVKFGEQPQEALMREFLDITGLVIEPFVPFKTWSEMENDGGTQNIEICYMVDLDDPDDVNLVLSEDYKEYKWVEKDEINECVDEMAEEVASSAQMAFELYDDWNKQIN